MNEPNLSSLNVNTAQMRWISDALIPADETTGMASAVDVGLLTELLPKALAARPDLTEGLAHVLAQLPEDEPAEPLGRLLELSPAGFHDLTWLVSAAYFLSPDVNAHYGYSGLESLSYDPDYEEIDDVITRVIGRGPRYIVPG